MLAGLTRGVYVTTSGYQKSAERTRERYGRMGLMVELWDANEFYDRMQIAQRPAYELYDDPTSPFFRYIADPSTLPRCWTHGW